MQPWLLITCGLPFSGKSTLAKAAADMLGMVHVSVDDQHATGALAGADASDVDWLAAYSAAMGLAGDALAAGHSVVFDSVGHTRKNRFRLNRLANRHGARFGIIHMTTSREEALARLNANRAAPNRPSVPLASFEHIAGEFEAPGPDEPTVVYEPGQDLRGWVDTVLRTLVAGEGNL